MKKALLKDTFREIKKSFGRFISIFGIVLVGVAFFAGVKASSPYMKNSADAYFDKANLMDFRLLSTIGFTDDDVDAVGAVDGIEGADGAYSVNVITNIDTSEKVVNVMSYDTEADENASDYINRLMLHEGRMPEKSGECVIRDYAMKNNNLGIGDKIVFSSGTDDDIKNTLKTDEYTIVGTVSTPYYLSYQYDTASVGNGKVELIAFVPKSDFVSERYNVMYATAEGAKDANTYKDEYFEITDKVKERLTALADERTADSQKELDDAYELMGLGKENAPQVKWYVLDRNSHFSYVDYGNCADRMDAIAKVFPVFFYLVAALVCLTTMTRMVDEQRSQVGTMKALGYGKISIAMKYMAYAVIASLFGGVAGCFIGLNTFPGIIFHAWGIAYTIEGSAPASEPLMCILAVVIAVLVNVIAAFAACIGELTENPALLLRPKSPKNGKKVFLEHIGFIWKRMSFTGKVTARNILRYKKRFFMTVIGIAGCTALILAGFGIKDSVSTVVEEQYGHIFAYDMSGNFSDESDKDAFVKEYGQDDRIEDLLLCTQKTGTAKASESPDDTDEKNISFISVPDADRYSDFTGLISHKSGEDIKVPGDGALVTYKLAKDLGLKVGDELCVSISEDEYRSVKIADIITMYVGQYVIMQDDYYSRVFGEEAPQNIFIANIKVSGEAEQQLGADIIDDYDVESISYFDGIVENFKKMISSLNIITVVLIVSAALLAFVVLYNLINVNISERIREIATIKVLGFYDNEVSQYVYRENIVLTIIGSLVGLLLGVFLHGYIMDVIEMEDVIFPKRIFVSSYFISVAITIIFGVVVNLVMNRKLKKIPMVESLKSVE